MKTFQLAAISIAGLVAILATAPSSHAAAGDPYRVHALVGARVVTAPGRILPDATIVVRDGVIEAVSRDVKPPADARIWDVTGATIYAGFIDAYVEAGQLGGKKPEAKSDATDRRERPAETPRAPGNSPELASVHPDRSVARDLAQPTKENLEKLRALGFVAARVVPDDGLFRGSAAVISLGDGPIGKLMLRESAGSVVALDPQSNEYPGSLMGVLAVIRQTLADARWYEHAVAEYNARATGRERPPSDRALAALQPVLARREPLVVDAKRDPLNLLRVAQLAEVAKVDYQVLASGREYQRLGPIQKLGAAIILPLDYAKLPEVDDDPDEWELVATDELRDWTYDPGNPRWLADAGVTFALSTARLKDPATFAANLLAAIDDGLDREVALAALTTVPARMLGLDATLGSIEAGKIANFVVADGELFDAKTNVTAVWIDGTRYQTRPPTPPTPVDPVGTWHLRLFATNPSPVERLLEIKRVGTDLTAHLRPLTGPGAGVAADSTCVAVDGRQLTIRTDGDLFTLDLGPHGSPPTSVDVMLGRAETHLHGTVAAVAERLTTAEPPPPKRPRTPRQPPAPVGGPIASPDAVVVRGATIWTQGPAGRLTDADLLVVDGKVEAVGPQLTAPVGALVIDGHGMHVTPGLIDAHSHTALSGDANEGTRAVTAEVRIGDIVDSEDWNIYSELAGGLTVMNQLHGSANPIGGQSQTTKLRWGAPPDELRFAGAKPGIKFALGENVKQSNWGELFTTRYPQTRLGVQQTIRERFLAARDYMRKWDEYNSGPRTLAGARMPRTDYQLETIAEILRGERLLHCHSYRQDEILMLIRLMEEFGVTIATFQHVLEGYRVASEIAQMGAGASSFSDWWAYKFEVYDAIPYNGALMWDAGVVVSFNSDSNELARRLNTEATKAVKYGGVPAIEALNFVTLNPARQLRIDQWVGSLEPGKDGDFVIWNGDPLATFTRAEETWIDGKKYFDRTVDLARRGDAERERERLIDGARQAATKDAGGQGKPAGSGDNMSGTEAN